MTTCRRTRPQSEYARTVTADGKDIVSPAGFGPTPERLEHGDEAFLLKNIALSNANTPVPACRIPDDVLTENKTRIV